MKNGETWFDHRTPCERRTIPPVKVRGLSAKFFVDARVPEVGEVVSVSPDVATMLVLCGKAELVSG
jgi:hypothetical protein